jgi:hypothetical protein
MENGSWEQLPIGSIGLQNDIRPAVLSQTFLTKNLRLRPPKILPELLPQHLFPRLS